MTSTDHPDAPAAPLSEWEAHLLTYSLSEWEADLLHHFRSHVEQETGFLKDYEELAERSPDEFVRYLLTLVLDDERRHHRLFQELANAVVGQANLTRFDPSVPEVSATIADAAGLRDVTARFIDLEEQDRQQLRRLHKELRSVRDTTLWDLLVSIAEHDTVKHLLILRFIHDRAAEAAR